MVYILGMIFGFCFCVYRGAFEGEPPLKKAAMYALMTFGWFVIPSALLIDAATNMGRRP